MITKYIFVVLLRKNSKNTNVKSELYVGNTRLLTGVEKGKKFKVWGLRLEVGLKPPVRFSLSQGVLVTRGQRKRSWLTLDFAYGIHWIWKFCSGRFCKDIGRWGAGPLPINLHQKYIHTPMCTRANARVLMGSVFTGAVVNFQTENENIRIV